MGRYESSNGTCKDLKNLRSKTRGKKLLARKQCERWLLGEAEYVKGREGFDGRVSEVCHAVSAKLVVKPLLHQMFCVTLWRPLVHKRVRSNNWHTLANDHQAIVSSDG